MYRFMRVMGLPGKLVADPFRPSGKSPHFLGQKERVPAPTPTSDRELHLADFYEPIEQLVRVDALGRKHVLDAKAAGDLMLIGECVAPTPEAAEKAMTVVSKSAKSGKGGE